MKHNQHKTKQARTTYEVVKGNPMFGQSNMYFPLNTMSAQDFHELDMPDYTKLNKKG